MGAVKSGVADMGGLQVSMVVSSNLHVNGMGAVRSGTNTSGVSTNCVRKARLLQLASNLTALAPCTNKVANVVAYKP